MEKIFDLLGQAFSLDEEEEIVLSILAYAVKKLRPELAEDEKIELIFSLRSDM